MGAVAICYFFYGLIMTLQKHTKKNENTLKKHENVFSFILNQRMMTM